MITPAAEVEDYPICDRIRDMKLGRSGDQATHDTRSQPLANTSQRSNTAELRVKMIRSADTAARRLLDIVHSHSGGFAKMTLADAREISGLVIKAGILGSTSSPLAADPVVASDSSAERD